MKKSKICDAREDSARQPRPQQGSLQGGDEAGHPLAERQTALCWSSPFLHRSVCGLGEAAMHLRSVSHWEETASGLHSPQDKGQEMLPVMDARAWQLCHICPQPLPSQCSRSAQPLHCFLGGWRTSRAAQGWLVKAAQSPAEISAVSL